MSRVLQPVGQVVVTDPLGISSSGYCLVSSSPAVGVQDAHFLESMPQVTDHLHLGPAPINHFSFYPVPSGGWALTRRFADGYRRGRFNRIVVHSLVLPLDVLEAVAFDPWLLLGTGRFRAPTPIPEGPTWSLAGLGANAAAASGGTLPDLECIPPLDPHGERRVLSRRRGAYLRRHWTYRELRWLLVAVLEGIGAKHRILMPGRAETEQLLAWIWSALPAADRRESPWTTHLAPSGASLFRLALMPQEEIDRRGYEKFGVWTIFDSALSSGSGSGPQLLVDGKFCNHVALCWR